MTKRTDTTFPREIMGVPLKGNLHRGKFEFSEHIVVHVERQKDPPCLKPASERTYYVYAYDAKLLKSTDSISRGLFCPVSGVENAVIAVAREEAKALADRASELLGEARKVAGDILAIALARGMSELEDSVVQETLRRR
jgi:hypothetical protein